MDEVEAHRRRWGELFYPGTETLRNIPGLTDPSTWREAEANLSAFRTAEIPPTGFGESSVSDEIKAIHAHVFQDCYTWAGTFRTVNIGKEDSTFVDYRAIDERLAELDGTLNVLDGLAYDDKLEVFAYTHSELNQVHPFAEGNGRATRAFMTAIAARHDVAITWGDDHRALHQASRDSMAGLAATWAPFLDVYRAVCAPATFDDADMSIDDLLSSMDTSALTSASSMPGSFTEAIDTMRTALNSGGFETTPPPVASAYHSVQVDEHTPEL